MDSIVPEEDLASQIHSILVSSDLSVLTFKMLIGSLETHYDADLSHQRVTIKKHFDKFIDTMTFKDELNDIGDDVDGKVNDAGGEDNEDLQPNHSGSTPSISKKEGKGLLAPMQLSSELSEFLGVEFLPRTQVTKQMWDYIKANNLQNPSDRREILCDEKLEALFKRKKINMFKMTKALSQMMKTFDELQNFKVSPADLEHHVNTQTKKLVGESNKRKRQGVNLPAIKGKVEKVVKKPKKDMKRSPTTQKPVKLSPGLSELLNATELTSSQALKQLWVYIKERNLQDPEDKKIIRCDEALQTLFGQTVLHFAQVLKHLQPHLER